MAYLDFSHFADGASERFGRNMAGLARDARRLSDSLARHGAESGHDFGHLAHDVADEAMHQGAVAARAIGRQAWRAGKAVRKDPIPTVVAVAGLACLLSLVLSSTSRR